MIALVDLSTCRTKTERQRCDRKHAHKQEMDSFFHKASLRGGVDSIRYLSYSKEIRREHSVRLIERVRSTLDAK